MSVTKSGKDQASRIESAKRTEFAMDLFLQGFTNRQVNNALQKQFDLTYEGARVYTDKAIEQFAEENPTDKAKLRAKYTSMILDLYKKSYAKEHFKVCRELLETAAKFGMLLVPDSEIDNQKIQVTYSVIKKEKE